MADSSLVTYEDYNVPHDSGRTSGVGCVCVHHEAGNMAFGNVASFWRSRNVSAHYMINANGDVAQFVRESNNAYACGSRWANNCSISIECANDGGASSDWHVSDATINKCIDLIVDICKRKGWTQFRYTGSPTTGELFGHKEVASTECPGAYLYSKLPYIASEVQKRLSGADEKLYRVRKSWSDSKTQAGAYKKLENAKKKADEKKAEGYKVFDWDGNVVYEPTTAQLYRVRKTWADSKSQIGAYKSLERAIKVADEHEGYKVFDSNGACVYEPVAKADTKEEAKEETKEETKAEEKAETKTETKVEEKTEEKTEAKVEKKTEEKKTEEKTEAKTEKKSAVSKKKQKSILARLKEKYGKGAGR